MKPFNYYLFCVCGLAALFGCWWKIRKMIENENCEENYQEEEWIEMKDDDEDSFGNIFAHPDPFETFQHTFLIPQQKKNNKKENGNEQDDEEEEEGREVKELTITLVGRRADEAQMLSSTGLTLWRAAPILCNYLISNADTLVVNKNILELGAGMGMCGLVAAILGASSVFLSDGDSESLSNMRKNITQNSHLVPNTANMNCLQLKWGQKIEEFKRKCNLRTPNGLFDMIMGSDIIYVESILEPLFETVNALLSPEGSFVLAYARRNVRIDYVFRTAERYGFKWTEPLTAEGCFVFEREREIL